MCDVSEAGSGVTVPEDPGEVRATWTVPALDDDPEDTPELAADDVTCLHAFLQPGTTIPWLAGGCILREPGVVDAPELAPSEDDDIGGILSESRDEAGFAGAHGPDKVTHPDATVSDRREPWGRDVVGLSEITRLH
jgi:hypothetical protein